MVILIAIGPAIFQIKYRRPKQFRLTKLFDEIYVSIVRINNIQYIKVIKLLLIYQIYVYYLRSLRKISTIYFIIELLLFSLFWYKIYNSDNNKFDTVSGSINIEESLRKFQQICPAIIMHTSLDFGIVILRTIFIYKRPENIETSAEKIRAQKCQINLHRSIFILLVFILSEISLWCRYFIIWALVFSLWYNQLLNVYNEISRNYRQVKNCVVVKYQEDIIDDCGKQNNILELIFEYSVQSQISINKINYASSGKTGVSRSRIILHRRFVLWCKYLDVVKYGVQSQVSISAINFSQKTTEIIIADNGNRGKDTNSIIMMKLVYWFKITAFILVIMSALICVVYGYGNCNTEPVLSTTTTLSATTLTYQHNNEHRKTETWQNILVPGKTDSMTILTQQTRKGLIRTDGISDIAAEQEEEEVDRYLLEPELDGFINARHFGGTYVVQFITVKKWLIFINSAQGSEASGKSINIEQVANNMIGNGSYSRFVLSIALLILMLQYFINGLEIYFSTSIIVDIITRKKSLSTTSLLQHYHLVIVQIIVRSKLVSQLMKMNYQSRKYMLYRCTDRIYICDTHIQINLNVGSIRTYLSRTMLLALQMDKQQLNCFRIILMANYLYGRIDAKEDFEDLCINNYLSIDDLAIVETFGNDIRIILQIQSNIITDLRYNWVLLLVFDGITNIRSEDGNINEFYDIWTYETLLLYPKLLGQQQLFNHRTGNITTFIATTLLQITNNVLKDTKYGRQYEFDDDFIVDVTNGNINLYVNLLILIPSFFVVIVPFLALITTFFVLIIFIISCIKVVSLVVFRQVLIIDRATGGNKVDIVFCGELTTKEFIKRDECHGNIEPCHGNIGLLTNIHPIHTKNITLTDINVQKMREYLSNEDESIRLVYRVSSWLLLIIFITLILLINNGIHQDMLSYVIYNNQILSGYELFEWKHIEFEDIEMKYYNSLPLGQQIKDDDSIINNDSITNNDAITNKDSSSLLSLQIVIEKLYAMHFMKIVAIQHYILCGILIGMILVIVGIFYYILLSTILSQLLIEEYIERKHGIELIDERYSGMVKIEKQNQTPNTNTSTIVYEIQLFSTRVLVLGNDRDITEESYELEKEGKDLDMGILCISEVSHQLELNTSYSLEIQVVIGIVYIVIKAGIRGIYGLGNAVYEEDNINSNKDELGKRFSLSLYALTLFELSIYLVLSIFMDKLIPIILSAVGCDDYLTLIIAEDRKVTMEEEEQKRGRVLKDLYINLIIIIVIYIVVLLAQGFYIELFDNCINHGRIVLYVLYALLLSTSTSQRHIRPHVLEILRSFGIEYIVAILAMLCHTMVKLIGILIDYINYIIVVGSILLLERGMIIEVCIDIDLCYFTAIITSYYFILFDYWC